MKSNQWQYLGFLLVIMMMFYVLSKVGDRGSVASTDDLYTIDKADVGRIRIAQGGQVADVTRLDSVWVMTGFEETPVPIAQLDGFFYGILNAKRETMISENPAKWDKYGVDDSTGVHFELFDLENISAGYYLVGASKSNTMSSYIRAQGTDEVYLTTIPIHYGLQQLPGLFMQARQAREAAEAAKAEEPIEQ